MTMQDDAYYKAAGKMQQQERELNALMNYPPFSEIDDGRDSMDFDGVNPDWGFPSLSTRGMELQQAMGDAVSGINIEKGDRDIYECGDLLGKCFKGVYEEFKDDLEEARLMQKRYPRRLTALKAVALEAFNKK